MLDRRQFLGNFLLAFAGGSLLACLKSPVLEAANARSSNDNNDKEVTIVQFTMIVLVVV